MKPLEEMTHEEVTELLADQFSQYISRHLCVGDGKPLRGFALIMFAVPTSDEPELVDVQYQTNLQDADQLLELFRLLGASSKKQMQ